ncbi:MAG: hypothetical protein ACM31L_02720 [Actinomycetota bacterium]
MRALPEPDNRVFLGVGGSGKSTLAREMSFAFPQVIICDPNGEPAHAANALVVDNQLELVSLLQLGQPVRIAWRGFDTMGEEAGLEWACRCAWAAGDTLVVWDETDLFSPFIRNTSSAYRLWNAGRHRGCRVFSIARSPFAIPRTLTRNMTRACVFGTQEPADLQYLAGSRTRPGMIGAEAAGALPTLAKYHCVDWHRGGAWAVKKAPFT